jgi:uncharacterized membrane-anchored protein
VSAALTRVLIVLGALLVFGSVNYSIFAKENIKKHGEAIYLQLAPVDPRSLMQGDYMALRFSIATEFRGPAEGDGIPLQLDERRIARIAEPSSAPSLRMRYRVRNGEIWLGTNAYFFEEGTAERFAGATYGKFRIDAQTGEAVLVALCDEQLRELGASPGQRIPR